MHRYLGLFIFPFVFTVLLDIAVNNFHSKDEKIYLTLKKNLIPISAHINNYKNFEIAENFYSTNNYNSSQINKIYSEKFIDKDFVLEFNDEKIYLTLKKNIIPINVHLNNYKNFEIAENFYSTNNYNSSQINKIYSEKFIDKDFVLEFNIEKILDKSIELTLVHSIQLPKYDWKQMFSPKKIAFIETVLPIIAFENQKISNERKKITEIKRYLQVEKTLIDGDIIYLNQIAKKYLLKSKNKHKIDLIDELLILVDVIPNSIVLAQAVNESGWGTSRFAKEHNALFGQYTYEENEGVIPFQREEGKKHLIKYFSSFNKSVESYFKNINTHYAYKKFRNIRSQINKKDLLINIKLLTQALDVYAEDELYVDTINSIIDSNKFNQFDGLIKPFINS